MRRILFIFLLLLFFIHVGIAQDGSRDYAIVRIDRILEGGGGAFIIEFEVQNQGADAQSETQYSIFIVASGQNETTPNSDFADAPLTASGRILADGIIQPLANGETVTIQERFVTEEFQAGTVQVFQVEVAIDIIEIAGTAVAQNNSATISVEIPSFEQADSTNNDFIRFEGDLVIIGDQGFPRSQVLIIALIAVVLVVLLFITLILLRLLFKRTPRFETWRPIYAVNAPFDPNSVVGRRQAWQHHAHNGSILAPCTEGAVHPVKNLLDTRQASKFGNWSITGTRLSQYDIYGRIGRSQTIAKRSQITQLNDIFQKRNTLANDAIRKGFHPVIEPLVKEFAELISKRNAVLPIAFDLRFRGQQGEVAIVFELYQCQRQNWRQIDSWEPEVTVEAPQIQENYTYTLQGQRREETIEMFTRRLHRDIEWILLEMMQKRGEYRGIDTPPETLSDSKPMSVKEAEEFAQLQESTRFKPLPLDEI